jgi:HlyD family secretion protein
MSPDKSTLDELRIQRRPEARRGSRAWIVILVLLLLLLGGAAAWYWQRPRTLAVRTAVVQATVSGAPRTLLNGSGYVTARRIATVSSKIAGKVAEVLIEEGKKVAKGEVLAHLDASNAERSLELAKAQLHSHRQNLEETKVNLAQAELDLSRTKQLAGEGIAAVADLDKHLAAAKSLQARLAKQTADVVVAEREVEVWKQQVDDTIIRAPFDGIVTAKNAQPGEMISPMSAGGFTRTGICTIVDMSSLEIEVDVSESYINRVESGLPVVATLDSYPDWKIPAKVIAIIPTADRQKATVKVRVAFEKLDARILPDMGVKVAFQSASLVGSEVSEARSVTVPKAAVRNDNGRDVVWLVAEGRLERRAVTAGATEGAEVTIVAGLTGGERVVVEGPAELSEGAKVVEKKR